jgi:hypothetical protein
VNSSSAFYYIFQGTGINFLLIGGLLVGVHEETIFKVHNWILKRGITWFAKADYYAKSVCEFEVAGF